MRKALRIALYLFAASLVGPLLWAALVALCGPFWRPQVSDDASRLVSTFDVAFPQSPPMPHIEPRYYYWRCGYDQDSLMGDFSAFKSAKRWTPYDGYLRLLSSYSQSSSWAVQEAREAHVRARVGKLEARFLDQCIKGTPFALACGYRVYSVLEEQGLYNRFSIPERLRRPERPGQLKTVCTFLDGVAARKGLRLGAAVPESAN